MMVERPVAFFQIMCYTFNRKFLKFNFEKIIAHGKLLVRVGRKTIPTFSNKNLESRDSDLQESVGAGSSQEDSQLPMVSIIHLPRTVNGFFYKDAFIIKRHNNKENG